MKATSCQKCKGQLVEVDGRDMPAGFGGMPGIKYQFCNACGWSRAIVKKPTRRELLANLKGTKQC